MIRDNRGFFARTYCEHEFSAQGISDRFVQCSLSGNLRKGTLRGLHFQKPPYAEAKLIRCTKGKVYDVAVDLRPNSQTFGKWFAAELSEENHHLFYLPQGFAHGFQALSDESEVFYQISEYYHAEAAAGVRWDDPSIAVSWPLANPILSPKDQSLPLLADAGLR
jgi:dTDP-4-dehydrorhamnose 3,5-epimerase